MPEMNSSGHDISFKQRALGDDEGVLARSLNDSGELLMEALGANLRLF